MGNKLFFKKIFLGENFGEHFLEEQILVRRKFHQQKYFGGIFVSKISV